MLQRFGICKKKKKAESTGSEPADLQHIDEADLAGIEPLETRYTQEYQDFLATQEAEEQIINGFLQ